MEIWKKIPTYPFYKASNIGRIRSISRISERDGLPLKRTGVILKPVLNDNGYYIVSMYNGKIKRHERVHRLVASTFIPNKQNKRTVNHKNGIKTDNRVENLEWATHGENHAHAYQKLGRKKAWEGITGGDAPCAKPISQYTKSGEFITTFPSGVDAEIATGINRSHFPDVCNGKRKSKGGYVWRLVL